jgi:uncharacterized protein YfiM (DUF2279 family)
MFRFSPNQVVLFFLTIIISHCTLGQSKTDLFLTPCDTLNRSRLNAVIITEAALGSGALIGLNQLWYSDYDQSKFHTIDDNNEWLQMDKLGHVLTSYHIGRLGADVLNWSGTNNKNQLIYGATLGLTFLTVVEVFDGFSEEWGFSWGDMASNFAGTGLYVGQELLWEEQRITFKYSFHQTKFAEKRPERLGTNFLEQTIKDYNGQTYWLSANIHSFTKGGKMPKWLNIAFGYGADGMLTGDEYSNTLEFPDQERIRQYYLSLDVDLGRIETNSRLLKSLFNVINFIKIPAPTFEINSYGKMKFHYLYF